MTLVNYVLHWDNTTYPLFLMSLMKKSYVDADPSIFCTILGMECFFLVPTILIAWYFAIVLHKYQLYHKNTCRIVVFNYFCYYVAFIGRIVTFLYEIEVIPTKGTVEDWPLLLFSFLRLQFTILFLFLVPSITVERWFASYFISDYEQSDRLWVFIIIALASFVGTLGCVITIMRGFFGFELCISFIIITLIFLLLFISIYKFNSHKLSHLHKYYNMNETYSLSIRYQLTENLRTMKHLIITGVLVFLSITIAVYLAANSVIWNDLYSRSGQIFTALFQMSIAGTAAIVIVSFEVVNIQFRKGNLSMIGSTPTKYVVDEHIRRSKSDATQLHFDTLSRFW